MPSIPSGANLSDVLTAEEAHKLRDYLTVILGSLEQLQHQSLDSRGRKQLQRAEAAAQEMAVILIGAPEGAHPVKG